MSIPSDIQTINSLEYQMEVCARNCKVIAGCEKGKGFIISMAKWRSVQSVQECFRNSMNSVEIDKSSKGKNRLYQEQAQNRWSLYT